MAIAAGKTGGAGGLLSGDHGKVPDMRKPHRIHAIQIEHNVYRRHMTAATILYRGSSLSPAGRFCAAVMAFSAGPAAANAPHGNRQYCTRIRRVARLAGISGAISVCDMAEYNRSGVFSRIHHESAILLACMRTAAKCDSKSQRHRDCALRAKGFCQVHE
jgi:hypothetical protein